MGKTLPLPWGSGAKSAKVIGEWGNIKKVIDKKEEYVKKCGKGRRQRGN